ncbi:MAG: SIS domain-containing protein, partial [Actinomycetes bacterium]
MCGIIAVVRRPTTREPASVDDVVRRLDAASTTLAEVSSAWTEQLAAAAELLESVDADLRGIPGVLTLTSDPAAMDRIAAIVAELAAVSSRVESELDAGGSQLTGAALEDVNASLIRVKDAVWAIGRDRLRAANEVARLAPTGVVPAGLAVLFSLHQALSAVDRLEVRGRDSAGIEVQLTGHGIAPDDPILRRALAERSHRSFTSGSVRVVGDVLLIVYKTSAEIGELGDNTAALRAAMLDDELLHLALRSPTVEGIVLGHTRWASIGIISEPNAHPQSSEELDGADLPLTTAVLNGDVDNYADLIAGDGLRISSEITTDAKVIPTLLSRQLAAASPVQTAFRETVVRLEGSVAIAAASTADPDRLMLALRGSGQALYVGVAEDAYIVASEPYGVVEETARYLRMDGETPSDPDNPTGSRGQMVVLSAAEAGTTDGIGRWSYDGTELHVSEADLDTAQITTRDIDRGDFPHYLLKEITDSPGSFRKTLRGKLFETDGRMQVQLPDATLPVAVRERLRDGRINRVQVIGQGTAAVAGQSLAHHLTELLAESSVRVEALPATELSGFRLRADMSDTLIVAISQSGTTTDTNRTVDLVRGRGALCVAIVNRRNSDLTDKADGVLYTSDGRDVEMSVAST